MRDRQLPAANTSILIAVVNYRTPKLTLDLLHSLVPEVLALPAAKVVVVDNNSEDGSVPLLQEAIAANSWGSWAALIAAERNGGFACGNNLAIRPALAAPNPPRYVLLLNPDTVVRPGAVKMLVDFMEEHPEVGIGGSRLEDPDGTPQHSAFRFHTIWSELDSGLRLGLVSQLLKNWIVAPPVSESACMTDWVAGASMIVRREVFQEVGLLDEGYFMYYEEMDFCLQAKKAGWNCWYIPQSRVVHLVGQSSGVTNTKVVPKRRPQYWFDSRRRYFLKNYSRWYGILADVCWIGGFLTWKARKVIQGKTNPDPPYLLEDFWRNSMVVKY